MIREDDDEIIFSRYCPLTRDICMRSDCMWFLNDRICAIVRIATRLDVLLEGVPVIRVV